MPLIEDPAVIRSIAAEATTIAVVGISPRPERDSHRVSAYLQSAGKRIVGVHPSLDRVLDAPCYDSLSDIPDDVRAEIDLVLVFRRPEAVPALLEEAAELGLGPVWLQLGVSSPAAIARAESLGLTLIAETCIQVVHQLYARA